ncbi:DUF2238 domain-containing protein [Sabulicella glaciei]|nr:DUF2238 domain-containing protein [Roseococcus sp. MDT2-1-1]
MSNGSALAWTLAVVLIALNIAGYVFDLYSAFWWFDRIVHAATVFALTFWFTEIVLRDAIRGGRDVLFVVLVSSVGIAAGALWEVAEWAFDAFAPGDVIKGKNDTLIDVLMDTAGSVAAALLANWHRTRRVRRAAAV